MRNPESRYPESEERIDSLKNADCVCQSANESSKSKEKFAFTIENELNTTSDGLSESNNKNGYAIRSKTKKRQKKSGAWYDYMWIFSLTYLILGFFNILFAWLGLLCFFIPLIISALKGTKGYCNRYCGRGQLFGLIGGRLGLSRKKDIPRWMKSKWFRYGFLIFFFAMFFLMLWNTYLVFAGTKELGQAVTLLWTFRLPWHWAYHGTLFHPGVAQFAFGFYSVMLTSTVLGFVTMIFFKPRSWCVYCPMGTMTQLICKAKNISRK